LGWFLNYDIRLFFNGWSNIDRRCRSNNNRRRWRSYHDSRWARDIDVYIDSGIRRGCDTQQECDNR